MYSLLFLAIMFILLIGGREYYSVFYGLVLIIFFSYLYSIYIKKNISIIIFSDKNEVFRDQSIRYEIVAQNNAFLPIFNIRLTVKTLDIDCNVKYIAPFAQFNVNGSKSFEKRGRYVLGPAEMSGREPFGLFAWHKEIPSKNNITVFPRVYQSDDALRYLRDENGIEALSITQDGSGPYDVRRYIPGDSFKKIHWKLSAKHNDLMVREYRDSQKSGIAILFDMKKNIYDVKGEEEALSLLLTAMESFLKRNMTSEVLFLNKEINRVVIKDKKDFKILLDSLVDMNFEGTIKDDFLYNLLLSEEFEPALIIVPRMNETIYRLMNTYDCKVLIVVEDIGRQDERVIAPSMWRDIFEKYDSKTYVYVPD